MIKKLLLIICAACLLMTGCGENSQAQEAKTLNAIKITVGGKTFTATLEDNPSARAFAESFPLEVTMNELNGNEKFVYLDRDLPSNSEHVGKIHSGDLMLFGSNCVVIFYKNFSTGYSYTRLGKLEDAAALEKVLGAGNVHVKFAE